MELSFDKWKICSIVKNWPVSACADWHGSILSENTLTHYLIWQFWALPIQQQNKDVMSKTWTMRIQLSD